MSLLTYEQSINPNTRLELEVFFNKNANTPGYYLSSSTWKQTNDNWQTQLIGGDNLLWHLGAPTTKETPIDQQLALLDLSAKLENLTHHLQTSEHITLSQEFTQLIQKQLATY